MATAATEETRPRVALYGHDTQGLGHLRRNLNLAAGFARDHADGQGADVLILTGATEVGLFERPAGVETVVVPGIRKDARGAYRPRRLRGHGLGDVVDLRSSTINGALDQFDPDILVVDKAPWGFAGELTSALRALKRRGTRLVLGLRDVLDEPGVAAKEWQRDHGDRAVREFYDEVWVYGDQGIHDLAAAARMAKDVRTKVTHVGYVLAENGPHLRPPRPVLPGGLSDYALVMVGGGQDGDDLARAAVAAKLPPGLALVVLTGPQMRADVVRELKSTARPDTVVSPFSPHASQWLARARAAVTMGGANTVTEILGTDIPSLVVPRVTPRAEQFVRAKALAARRMVDVIEPGSATPSVIAHWLRTHVDVRVDRSGIDLDGVRTARERSIAMLAPAPGGEAPGIEQIPAQQCPYPPAVRNAHASPMS